MTETSLSAPPPTPNRILTYNGGQEAVAVFNTPGSEFSVADLVGQLADDSQAYDEGSVVVQVGNGKHNRQFYYLDGRGIVDSVTGENRAFPPSDPSLLKHPNFKLAVGQPWYSPLGKRTAPVQAILLPWTHGIPGQAEPRDFPQAPTSRGKQFLDHIFGKR